MHTRQVSVRHQFEVWSIEIMGLLFQYLQYFAAAFNTEIKYWTAVSLIWFAVITLEIILLLEHLRASI